MIVPGWAKDYALVWAVLAAFFMYWLGTQIAARFKPPVDVPAPEAALNPSPSGALVRVPQVAQLDHALAVLYEETDVLTKIWVAEQQRWQAECRSVETTYGRLIALEAAVKGLREAYAGRRDQYRLLLPDAGLGHGAGSGLLLTSQADRQRRPQVAIQNVDPFLKVSSSAEAALHR